MVKAKGGLPPPVDQPGLMPFILKSKVMVGWDGGKGSSGGGGSAGGECSSHAHRRR